ncbi:hypothetical protein HYW21_04955 [Candidatus Woesearchaeota archaeon]|nr:hypothetical protein [Candidatus Woesearchaeota archaeon]
MKKTSLISYLLLFVLILFFVSVEMRGLFQYDLGDEWIYFYMGRLVTEGYVPYTDFFFAHPPLHLYLTALAFLVSGFHITFVKLIPLISTLISGLVLFFFMKKTTNSLPAALVTTALFLLSYNTLLEATYGLGINETTMFVVIALYFLFASSFRYRVFASGISFGLAGITGLYSLVPFLVIGLYLLVVKRSEFLHFLLGFCLIFGTVNLLFFIISGMPYLSQVYLYHLLKPKGESNTIHLIGTVIRMNFFLVASALLALLTRARKHFTTIWLVALAYVLFLLALNRIFAFYFVLLFPFLAILGGFGLVLLFTRLYEKFPRWIFFVIIAGLGLFFLWNLTADALYLNRFDFASFDSLEEMVTFIQETTSSKETIFGDDSSVPLLALLADRSITLQEVDTNDMRFRSGLTSISELIKTLNEAGVRYVIIRPYRGIGMANELSAYLQDRCFLVQQYNDGNHGDFLVYDCKKT